MHRPGPRASVGLVVGLAAFVATAVLAVTRSGSAESPKLPLAPLSDLGPLRPAAPGPLGPEGVPVTLAGVLARPQPLHGGQVIDGIACQAAESVLFHIHAHLSIFVDGEPRQVPAGIGLAPPLEVAKTPAGPFVAGAACFMWLHTHAADGIIHTESPIKRVYTLGDFFDIWGQQLGPRRVGPDRGAVVALFNGRVFTGNPRQIPLLAHAEIQLDVGRPLTAPEHINFAQGL